MRWVPRLADTSRVLHWDYNDICVFEVPLELQHSPARPVEFFPTNVKFWLPAVIGELQPNRCTGIIPKVSPPIHSDLCPPTAYATREVRHGHIPGSRRAYLNLPVLHRMSPVCRDVPHVLPSLGTYQPRFDCYCSEQQVRQHEYS